MLNQSRRTIRLSKVMKHEKHKNGKADRRSGGDPAVYSGNGHGRASAGEYGDGRSHDIGTLAVRPGHRHSEHGRPDLARKSRPHGVRCSPAQPSVQAHGQRQAQSLHGPVHGPCCSCAAQSTRTQRSALPAALRFSASSAGSAVWRLWRSARKVKTREQTRDQ
jgi:hypothetical protein